MAKRVPASNADDDTTEIPVVPATSAAGPSVPAESLAEPVKPPPVYSTYRVHLKCPTPLAKNPADIRAASEDDAWQQFMAINGIGGSDHERTIELAKE